MLTGRKLALTLAFTGLVALATGVSCKGFFVKPTLTSVAISPPTANISDGSTNNTQQFAVVATFDDGSHGSTPVTWSISAGAPATLSSSGLATSIPGATGTATITAASTILPNISGTASLTVLATVTLISVNPTSGSTVRGSGVPQNFAFTATINGVAGQPLTSANGGTLTITPSSSDVTCTVSGNDEACSADLNANTGPYSVTMTYPNSTASATATLTVN
jgi:hypothetical protein